MKEALIIIVTALIMYWIQPTHLDQSNKISKLEQQVLHLQVNSSLQDMQINQLNTLVSIK